MTPSGPAASSAHVRGRPHRIAHGSSPMHAAWLFLDGGSSGRDRCRPDSLGAARTRSSFQQRTRPPPVVVVVVETRAKASPRNASSRSRRRAERERGQAMTIAVVPSACQSAIYWLLGEAFSPFILNSFRSDSLLCCVSRECIERTAARAPAVAAPY